MMPVWVQIAIPVLTFILAWIAASLRAGYSTGQWTQRSEQAHQVAAQLSVSVAHLSEAVHALDKQVVIWTETVKSVKERLSYVGGQLLEQDRIYRALFLTKSEALPMFAKAAEDHKAYDEQHREHVVAMREHVAFLREHDRQISALLEWQTIVKGRPNRRETDDDA